MDWLPACLPCPRTFGASFAGDRLVVFSNDVAGLAAPGRLAWRRSTPTADALQPKSLLSAKATAMLRASPCNYEELQLRTALAAQEHMIAIGFVAARAEARDGRRVNAPPEPRFAAPSKVAASLSAYEQELQFNPLGTAMTGWGLENDEIRVPRRARGGSSDRSASLRSSRSRSEGSGSCSSSSEASKDTSDKAADAIIAERANAFLKRAAAAVPTPPSFKNARSRIASAESRVSRSQSVGSRVASPSTRSPPARQQKHVRRRSRSSVVSGGSIAPPSSSDEVVSPRMSSGRVLPSRASSGRSRRSRGSASQARSRRSSERRSALQSPPASPSVVSPPKDLASSSLEAAAESPRASTALSEPGASVSLPRAAAAMSHPRGVEVAEDVTDVTTDAFAVSLLLQQRDAGGEERVTEQLSQRDAGGEERVTEQQSQPNKELAGSEVTTAFATPVDLGAPPSAVLKPAAPDRLPKGGNLLEAYPNVSAALTHVASAGPGGNLRLSQWGDEAGERIGTGDGRVGSEFRGQLQLLGDTERDAVLANRWRRSRLPEEGTVNEDDSPGARLDGQWESSGEAFTPSPGGILSPGRPVQGPNRWFSGDGGLALASPTSASAQPHRFVPLVARPGLGVRACVHTLDFRHVLHPPSDLHFEAYALSTGGVGAASLLDFLNSRPPTCAANANTARSQGDSAAAAMWKVLEQATALVADAPPSASAFPLPLAVVGTLSQPVAAEPSWLLLRESGATITPAAQSRLAVEAAARVQQHNGAGVTERLVFWQQHPLGAALATRLLVHLGGSGQPGAVATLAAALSADASEFQSTMPEARVPGVSPAPTASTPVLSATRLSLLDLPVGAKARLREGGDAVASAPLDLAAAAVDRVRDGSSCNEPGNTLALARRLQSADLERRCGRGNARPEPRQPATPPFLVVEARALPLSAATPAPQPLVCSLCEQKVRGLATCCPACGHGGHADHIRQWFAGFSKGCPVPACGCTCLSESATWQASMLRLRHVRAQGSALTADGPAFMTGMWREQQERLGVEGGGTGGGESASRADRTAELSRLGGSNSSRAPWQAPSQSAPPMLHAESEESEAIADFVDAGEALPAYGVAGPHGEGPARGDGVAAAGHPFSVTRTPARQQQQQQQQSLPASAGGAAGLWGSPPHPRKPLVPANPHLSPHREELYDEAEVYRSGNDWD